MLLRSELNFKTLNIKHKTQNVKGSKTAHTFKFLIQCYMFFIPFCFWLAQVRALGL